MSLRKAYEDTIEDFRIDLCNTSWWKLKRIDYIQKQMEHYQELLDNLKDK